MKQETNNPASRLYYLINRGKALSGARRAADAWAELLGVEKKNNSSLLMRVGHVMALPSIIKEQIHSIENIGHESYLKWLPQVEAAFATLNFETNWMQFVSRFDDKVMLGLEICADQLSRNRPEKIISEEDISNLHTRVQELLNEIQNANFPEQTKQVITENLENIKHALEEYSVTGFASVQKSFNATVGSIYINHNYYVPIKDSSFSESLWDFITKMALLVGLAGGALQITSEVRDLFPVVENTNSDDFNYPKPSDDLKEIA